jgi:peptidoglycan/xylan/chitin deacetylase (PgdA/CDA1 family)
MLSVKHFASHTASRVLHAYADWRIGASYTEKHCHKPSDTILLTFDDYGSREEVTEILGILAHDNVKAIFFLQGSWANEHADLVTQIENAGHIIGNHTYSHKILLSLDDLAATEEIERGVPSIWLRPPEGRYDQRIRQLAARLNYRICYWTIDSRDWTDASVAAMRHTIVSELRPGAVILFHLHGAHTRELLRTIIPDIQARGYTFASHDETW